ncbi:MAG: hypothetical protein VYC17_03760 [Nitrospinota bacterium]|nr:hypothetical protein [Nitrospinota bacterium]
MEIEMAKPITISVPDDLSEELKKFPEIKVSATCQEALQKGLDDLKACKLDDEDLLGYAEKRFLKELEKEEDEYRQECRDAGENWAACHAGLEELKKIFEEDDTDRMFFVQSAFVGHHTLPSHIYDRDADGDGSNELLFEFKDGAESMWERIKERLEEKGYEL